MFTAGAKESFKHEANSDKYILNPISFKWKYITTSYSSCHGLCHLIRIGLLQFKLHLLAASFCIWPQTYLIGTHTYWLKKKS